MSRNEAEDLETRSWVIMWMLKMNKCIQLEFKYLKLAEFAFPTLYISQSILTLKQRGNTGCEELHGH